MSDHEDDAEAAALMAKWDAEHGGGDDSDDDDDNKDDDVDDMDDLYDKYRREVVLRDDEVDHLILGVSNLEQATQDFEKLSGVKPLGITRVNGLGVAHARVAFEDGCAFLEILGPDEKQGTTELKEKLENLPEGEYVPVHYAVRSAAALKAVEELKLSTDKVTLVDKDQGMPVLYDYCIVEGHDDIGLVPNYVTWKSEQGHPAGKLPIVGNLDSVQVTLCDPNPAHKIFDHAVEKVEVELGDEPKLAFNITTTDGKPLNFSATKPVGYSFPKLGGLEPPEPGAANKEEESEE